MAYTLRNTCVVKYGYYREYFDAMTEVNDLCAKRGLKTARMWAPLAGQDNTVVMEIEYDSLAQLEEEAQKFFTDADIMKSIRVGAEHVMDGTSRTEIFMEAQQIA
jgi:hypothetical protein